MKIENLKKNEWIPVQGWGFTMEDLEEPTMNSETLGIIVFFVNGLVEFKESLWFKGNVEVARTYRVHKFMVIQKENTI